MHMIVNKRSPVLDRLLAFAADRALLIVLVLAAAVRLAAIVAFPSLHHPDENFQLFEQAHRIAFGYGVVPWEFRDGIRSPVLPYVLAALFRISEPVVGGPEGYLLVARAALAAVSLLGVAAVYRMGERTSRTDALMAGVVAATWFELVYFAGRPLTEAVATTFLLVALSLASVPQERLAFRRLLAIGFCLGLALMLRIHLAVGLLVVAVWWGNSTCAGAGPRWRSAASPAGRVRGCGLAVLGRAVLLLCGGVADRSLRGQGLDLRRRVAGLFLRAAERHLGRRAARDGGADPVARARVRALDRGGAGDHRVPHGDPAQGVSVRVPASPASLWWRHGLGRSDRAHPSAAGPDRPGPALVGLGAALWVGTSAALAFAPGFMDNWFEAGDLIEASFELAQDRSVRRVVLQ